MWKRTKKLFLFLTGLAIVHTFIILQVLWWTHKKYRE
jgi:nitrogen fixation-related uncharacterized protein